jgi:5,10-methenyltetrahydrofolate synthetase
MPDITPDSIPDPPSPTSPDAVARWRTAERARLLAARRAQGVAAQAAAAAAISGHLEGLLRAQSGASRPGRGPGAAVSGYWPIKGEPDLRPLLAALHGAGVAVALPVVETRAAPLVFRRWWPGMAMVRGHWNIPVPPPEAAAVVPGIVLAPVVGWDGGCWRLGYGGGYFDRTLAALHPRPLAIGIGLASARIDSIRPQPHDIALDLIVTEAGVHRPG